MSYRNSIPRIIRQLPIASSEPPSILPPSFDPFRNSITAPVQGSSSANRLLRPIAKKRRITEEVGASKAVKLAISLLEDEFKLRESLRRLPPEISSSHFRSSIARYVDEVSVACDRSIYCSCGSYVSKGDIVGGVLRVFSHPARLVVRSPRQWRIRNNNDIHYVRCHRSDLEQISIRLIINMILSGFRKDIWMNVITIETPGIFVLPAIQLLPT